MIILNKVLVLGCSRSGTTEFCKTLQEVSSKNVCMGTRI